MFTLLRFAFLASFVSAALAAPPIWTPAPSHASPKTGAAGTAVRFNAEELFAMQPGDLAEVALPDGGHQVYVYERTLSHGGGINTWIARGALRGDNERAIITNGPGGTWGWLSTPYGKYGIRPDVDGIDRVARRAAVSIVPADGGPDAIVAPDDPPHVAPFKGVDTVIPAHSDRGSSALLKATPADARRADLMIIYTRDLAAKLGAGLLPMLYNVVTTANQSYADSEVALSMRLVNATMLDLPNSYGSTDVLNGMANGVPSTNPAVALNGIFQPLTWAAGASVRDQFGADMVALLRDGPTDTGGIAFLLANPTLYPTVSATRTAGYSVINYCASGCEEIFAHEIGHNLGQSHDRATEARDGGGTISPTESVFPYSFAEYSCINGLSCNPFVAGGCPDGYAACATPANANDFGTLMSYIGPVVLKFSNPGLTCYPAGGSAAAARPCGQANSTDSARAINETRQNISAYRNQVIAATPGSLQFTGLSYSGTETSGTIVFTVSRASGSSGAVSVNYAVTAGTATAARDFTAVTGTLTWADGDAANKTFNVPLVNDLASEGIETLLATLSNPSGAVGVYLGYPASAMGLVLETWPAGGVMPAGWTQSSGSSVPWAVATDSSADGDNLSLKSGALDFAAKGCTDVKYGAVPCPSMIQYTSVFAEGTIGFSYRVSSFPGYGFLEFFVDGVMVQQATGSVATGDSGWQYFSAPISAGAHTLRWQYRTRFSSGCNLWTSSDGRSYPGCVDRAWIDDVSLPVLLYNPTTTLATTAASVTVGQSVTFTATVAGGSAGTPTGTIQFLDGASAVAGCPTPVTLVAGAATCTTTTLAAGVHSITAFYSGSAVHNNSVSNAVSQTVSVGTQLLGASPATLDFGGQSMNTTSPAASVTVTNISAGPVTVAGITPPAGYAVSSSNCTVLAPAATCTIAITFTPTTQGTMAGSLSIDYAGGAATVALTGLGERSLVTHYYRSILRRAPDTGGKAFWEAEAARVGNIGADVNETWYAMAMSFYFSAEYAAFNRDNSGFVTDLYNTFFNRTPDPGGLAFWKSQLDAGLPREVALAGFMFSAEFGNFTRAIFGNTAVRPEVNTVVDFYRGLLGRLPDSGGFAFWVQQFRTAQCQGAAAVYAQVEAISSAYALSPEYAGRGRTNAQYVGDLYNAFLRRGGDLAGVQYWIGQVATGAQTREQVRRQFVASPEFNARVNAIVSTPCLP